MAGSIYLSLTQQFDKVNGRLLAGGRLYSFATGTTNPQDAFEDEALTTPYANPIVLDTDGRIPQLFYANGTVRCRLLSSAGTQQFDQDNIIVLGAASSITPPDPVDPTAIYQTGDPMWVPISGTRSGWVRLNARTIGSATSGASERANADCEDLYAYLWENYSDTLCPVATGRGATAAADWAANKAIGTLDMRSRGPFGLDDMGGSAASRLTGATFGTGNATTAASNGGEGAHALVSAENGPHTHTTSSDSHSHNLHIIGNVSAQAASGVIVPTSIDIFGTGKATSMGATDAAASGVVVDSSGSGTAHNNMPPFVLGTWYMKL